MQPHFCSLLRLIRQTCGAERGASIVEYALLLSLIAVVCILAVTTLGADTSNSLSSAAATI